jgi:LCP family protein required for cell wall assembly
MIKKNQMAELKKDFDEEIINKIGENPTKEDKTNTSAKKSIFKKAFYSVVFIFVAFFLFSNRVTISEQADSFIGKIPLIGQLSHLANSSDRELKGEKEGRINILLLGMGGKGHEGGYLTDTIMLASLDPETKKVSLISIPRDLSIPVEGSTNWTKINNINAFAEVKESGSGGIAISQALSDILEVPIDYYFRLDFEGFTNIINKVGGVDVNVEKAFDDYSYPAEGQEDNPNWDSRYEHLHFEKGWQKMNGELALKYARSRHGNNGEGSDFARARRQQLVITAAKEKLLKANTLLNPVALGGIIMELNEHLSTNLKTWEAIKIWNEFKDTSRENISSKVLDNGPNGLLHDGRNEQGAYVLTPKNGDFSEIKYLVQNIFQEAPTESKTSVITERTKLKILNGTWVNGLANRTAMDLEKYGFDIIGVSNSSQRNFEKSVIYDLAFG